MPELNSLARECAQVLARSASYLKRFIDIIDSVDVNYISVNGSWKESSVRRFAMLSHNLGVMVCIQLFQNSAVLSLIILVNFIYQWIYGLLEQCRQSKKQVTIAYFLGSLKYIYAECKSMLTIGTTKYHRIKEVQQDSAFVYPNRVEPQLLRQEKYTPS